MNATANLGKAPVRTLVLQLAIPSMTAQFVNVLYSIIDRMYIGHISENGALALAGAGICGPIVTLLTSFGTLVGIGGSITMGIRMGEKNHKKAEQVLANSFLIFTLSTITLIRFFAVFPFCLCSSCGLYNILRFHNLGQVVILIHLADTASHATVIRQRVLQHKTCHTGLAAIHQILMNSLETFFAIVIICIDDDERGLDDLLRCKHGLTSSPTALYGLPAESPEYR